MAEGRLRAEWDRTGAIVAKIHNAFFVEKISPREVGPYATEADERANRVGLDEIATILEGVGAKIETVPVPDWLKEEVLGEGEKDLFLEQG